MKAMLVDTILESCSSSPYAHVRTSLWAVWGEAGSVREMWTTAWAFPADGSLLFWKVDMYRLHRGSQIHWCQRISRASPVRLRELVIRVVFTAKAFYYIFIVIPQSMTLKETNIESLWLRLYLLYWRSGYYGIPSLYRRCGRTPLLYSLYRLWAYILALQVALF